MMNRIIATTHSRIPVYRGSNRKDIVGLMIVKLLIKLDPEDATPVSQLGMLLLLCHNCAGCILPCVLTPPLQPCTLLLVLLAPGPVDAAADLRSPLVISPDTPMFTALNMFQTGVSHLALVSSQADMLRRCLETSAPTPATVVNRAPAYLAIRLTIPPLPYCLPCRRRRTLRESSPLRTCWRNSFKRKLRMKPI